MNVKQSINLIDMATEKKKQATPSGYQTTIEINGYEYDCVVDYEYIRGCKGSRNKYGVPVEPDEHSYIDMGEVFIFSGNWFVIDVPEEAMTDTLAEILAEHEG